MAHHSNQKYLVTSVGDHTQLTLTRKGKEFGLLAKVFPSDQVVSEFELHLSSQVTLSVANIDPGSEFKAHLGVKHNVGPFQVALVF